MVLLQYLLPLLLCFLQFAMSTQLRTLDVPWVEPPAQHRHQQNPELSRIMSFGHLPALVDWLWIHTLGDTVSNEGSLNPAVPQARSQLYYDLNLITDLDPAFFNAYFGGAELLAIVRKEPESARDLVSKGVEFTHTQLARYSVSFRERFWHEQWSLSVLLAYVYLFELGDMNRASLAFQEAGGLPHAPEYVVHLRKRLSAPGGGYEVGIKLLDFMARGAVERGDEKRVKELEWKKYNLAVGEYLYHLNFEFRERRLSWNQFLKSTHRTNHDPWGGVISLNSQGEVISSTPHEAVFKLK